MTASVSNLYADVLRTDFTAFIHRAFQELNPQLPYVPSWHIELLAAKLEDVRVGPCKRLVVCLPPRHFKSFIGSVVFPAWLLGKDPAKQILCVSYGQDLADKFARACRALIESPFYRYIFPTRLSDSRNAVAEFETTLGGCRIATSVGGAVTGRGGNVIIIDDFLKAEDAHSDARRKASNDWYDSTLRNRLNRQAEDAIVIINQRVHTDDIVAHVQEQETWDVVSLPAVAEQSERHEFLTPYGRRVVHRSIGEVLQPAVLPAAEIDRVRRGMTAYNFTAQFQQDPQPPEGLIVKSKWLTFYSPEKRPRFDSYVQSWDTATKATELSDYSVCTTWGVKDQRMYLLDVYRERVEFPELKRAVIELIQRWRPAVVLVEDRSSGTQLIQELSRAGYPQVRAAPSLDGDKVMRLNAQTAQIEGGSVLFPDDAPWLDDYLRELLSFPNSKTDDQVDSTVYALAWNAARRYVGWTDQSLKNLNVLTEQLAFARFFGA